jgi:hypothetical protein
MLGRRGRGRTKRPTHEATVWIDHEQAIVVERDAEGIETIAVLDREPAESEARFEARTAAEVVDEERVMVSGPADVRTQFDRAYVAATHRPDRLVDIEPSVPAARPVGRAG